MAEVNVEASVFLEWRGGRKDITSLRSRGQQRYERMEVKKTELHNEQSNKTAKSAVCLQQKARDMFGKRWGWDQILWRAFLTHWTLGSEKPLILSCLVFKEINTSKRQNIQTMEHYTVTSKPPSLPWSRFFPKATLLLFFLILFQGYPSIYHYACK